MSGDEATPAKPARWLQIDALRGMLVVFVIIFHVGLSYIDIRPWAFHEGSSMAVGLLMLVVRAFVMPCFFLISGFAARGLLASRGTAAFVRDRLLRIVLPFIVFLPVMRWSIERLWHWGDATMLRLDPAFQSSFANSFEVYPFAHLWFLYVVTLFYLAALALRRPLTLIAPVADAALAGVARARLLPVVAALPIGLTVLAGNKSFEPWIGVQVPNEIPNIFALVSYGTAFMLGWLLHRQQHQILPIIARDWHVTAIFAALMTVAHIVTLFGMPASYATLGFYERVPIAFAFAFACWGLIFAILGAFLRFLPNPPAWMRYVTLTSFWAYLVHFPLTMAVPIILQPLSLDPAVKFAATTAICLAVLFASYELLVRHTFLSTWLNGRAKPRQQAQRMRVADLHFQEQ